MTEGKLAICVVASVIAHVALARALEHLPEHRDVAPPHKIDVRVVPAPPLPPPPEPEPEKPPEPQPVVHDVPKHAAPRAPSVAPVAKDAPPPDHPAVVTAADATPVFGVTMESTSVGGTGPAVPIGNTLGPAPTTGSGAPVKPLGPVQAYEATKAPLPQGRCFGKYTDEARSAGLEGTVVLDLVVGEDGHAREIHVVSGLGKGLDEAAITALRDCTFSPGEKDGKPVAVRVRGFKIRFVLAEAN